MNRLIHYQKNSLSGEREWVENARFDISFLDSSILVHGIVALEKMLGYLDKLASNPRDSGAYDLYMQEKSWIQGKLLQMRQMKAKEKLADYREFGADALR